MRVARTNGEKIEATKTVYTVLYPMCINSDLTRNSNTMPEICQMAHGGRESRRISPSILIPQGTVYTGEVRSTPIIARVARGTNPTPFPRLLLKFCLHAFPTLITELEGPSILRYDNYVSAAPATPFPAFFTLCNLLLYKCSAQNFFAVGTAVIQRSTSQLQEVVDFFISTLPIRTPIEDGVTTWSSSVGILSPTFRTMMFPKRVLSPRLRSPRLSPKTFIFFRALEP